MNTEVVLSWQTIEGKPVYYLDSKKTGAGDEGFQQVIEMVSKIKGVNRLVVSFSLAEATGGKSFKASLPFSHRYDELVEITRSKQITLELKPVN